MTNVAEFRLFGMERRSGATLLYPKKPKASNVVIVIVIVSLSNRNRNLEIGSWTCVDRKATPTSVVVRRDDVSVIEIEEVRIERRRVGADSPVVSIAARAPQRASSHSHGPATS